MFREPILSENDLERISNAVREAERNTSGEIVPMVLGSSDAYAGAHWRMGMLVALGGAMLAATAYPEWPSLHVLWLEIPLLGFGYVLGAIPPLKRFLVGPKVMAREVHQRVVEQFHALGFSETKGRTGLVIAVSLLEHRVEILADVGIHQKAPAGIWNELVEKLLARIRKGELADGMIEAIGSAGEILARNFPATHDNPDELPNRVIVD